MTNYVFVIVLFEDLAIVAILAGACGELGRLHVELGCGASHAHHLRSLGDGGHGHSGAVGRQVGDDALHTTSGSRRGLAGDVELHGSALRSVHNE